MYLAVAVIDSPESPDDCDELRQAIESSGTSAERVEHVRVERHREHLLVALWLIGWQNFDAAATAEQLCRRALASRSGPWALRSCEARMIGPGTIPGVR